SYHRSLFKLRAPTYLYTLSLHDALPIYRPIYFIELRDGYACSWCELRGSQLTLIPHPLSPCSTRQFLYSTEAEIVGQVTAVAMRLVDSPDRLTDEAPKLTKRSRH